MAEKPEKNASRGTQHAGRIKLPWLDLFIVWGVKLRADDEKIETLEERVEILEREFQRQLRSGKISARMVGNLHHRIAVMTARLKAPECPKCGKPKTPGGIQWLDHAKCFAQGKSKKAKGENYV